MQNVFWEIEGIKGESTSAQGKEMVELLSFNHGVSMPLTAGPSNTSRASGRAVHQDFTVTKYLDITSPTLNLKCSGGEDIKAMKVHVWKADAAGAPHKYMQYTFESCIVTSVSVGGGADQPIETVTFNYKKISWEYAQQLQTAPGGAKGKAAAAWSLEQNTGK
ncbi:Hcp family type VI secretion system effector [Chondromyces apiculatus]|uniref:Putative cytoplasmic protein USSDB7A n=1 Tax=Chondromyces apiculatus DSM 436 TaxID=1192034 RepID=A0A017T2S6_9BACT|nr:type VI secretion system tube protein Hcp [Chondromyces apiculatus]EYF02866.1 Putative cytoplasmic protein USSDB7A [Chondromyces apiculatus DSM 436]